MLYYLNQRTGAIYKENNEGAKKTFSINWFFIGDDRRLYYHPTYSLIQKILRCCSTVAQASARFRHLNQKFVEISRYEIVGVQPFVYEGQLPVTNRTCIEIRERETHKALKLLPIVDEDAECMLHFLKGGVMGKTVNRSFSASPWRKHEQQQEPAPSGLIEQLPRLQRSLSVLSERGERSFIEQDKNHTETVASQEPLEPKVLKLNDNQHYVGEILEGLPHGGGKQVLLVDGLSFNGGFRRGKKHGRGYITNSSLDTLYCEFVDDQVCGI